jgi:hypothetical protein
VDSRRCEARRPRDQPRRKAGDGARSCPSHSRLARQRARRQAATATADPPSTLWVAQQSARPECSTGSFRHPATSDRRRSWSATSTAAAPVATVAGYNSRAEETTARDLIQNPFAVAIDSSVCAMSRQHQPRVRPRAPGRRSSLPVGCPRSYLLNGQSAAGRGAGTRGDKADSPITPPADLTTAKTSCVPGQLEPRRSSTAIGRG